MLTPNAIRRAYAGESTGNPVLQVLEIKRIQPKENPDGSSTENEWYRLVVSDGEFYQQSVLTTQLKSLVISGKLTDYCLIRLVRFVCNTVKTRKVLILSEVDVVSGPVPTIGNPQNIEASVYGTHGAAPGAANSSATLPTTTNPLSNQQSGMHNNSSVMHNNLSSMHNNNNNHAAGMHNNPSSAIVQNHQMGGTVIHPIASLNPYQNHWTIKARVTAKSEIRTWSNARGDGKLCSVDLLDKEGGQIRATMFNETVDRLYPLFQIDKVYVISKGQVKLANKKFSRLPAEYEITLTNSAEVSYVGDDATIETQRFDFCPIDSIQQYEPNSFVDVIGVVSAVQPLSKIVSKTTQKELTKRTITLSDRTLTSIELTLWGDSAEQYNEQALANNPILAVKAAKVSDFGGRTLACTFQSAIFLNPDRADAHELRAWFDREGSMATIDSLSKRGAAGAMGPGGANDVRKPISVVKDEGLGRNEKADFLTVRGTITLIKHEVSKLPWYSACPGKDCNKKVNPGNSGDFWCEKCNKSYPTSELRYILSLLVCDSSGGQWLTAFNEQATQILKRPASDLNAFLNEGNISAFENVFTEAIFKSYIFKIRAKAENSMDEMRVRCHILSAAPIDFAAESRVLVTEIDKYE